jgi:hypothetical protein
MAGPAADNAESLGDWFRDRLQIIFEEPGASPEPSQNRPTPTSLWDSNRWLPSWAGGSDVIATPPEQTPTTASRSTGSIQVEKLEGASKWAAGGFSAAAGLLLFFGVKEGVLDQAIRLNPFATLCVFILLGIGVLSALFAGAIAPIVRMRLWGIIAAVAVMLLLTALFLPNLDVVRDVEDLLDEGTAGGAPDWLKRLLFVLAALVVTAAAVALPLFVVRHQNTHHEMDRVVWILSALILLAAVGYAFFNARLQTRLSVAAGAILLLAIAWTFAEKVSLPAAAGVIILGVAATSLGLYGAAKLSVGSKIAAVDPQVSASLEQADGQTTLKIMAVASRMSGRKLLITVAGVPRIEELQPRDALGATKGEIWQSVLEPNSIDEIDAILSVPLSPTSRALSGLWLRDRV